MEYVSPDAQDFIADIEERERSGTPGVIQIMKAALVFLVKDAVGVESIEAREQQLLRRAFGRWKSHPQIEILGNPDPERRLGIVSFNLKSSSGRYLHPKFVTALLNDLFGIQSRAGCSCAGPYGHRLLGIDQASSERYRSWILKGFMGIKPGWCRVGFHYAMDDAEADYVIEAIEFVAELGERFVPLYRFDLHSGAWIHRDDTDPDETFSLAAAIASTGHAEPDLDPGECHDLYRRCLEEARHTATALPAVECDETLEGELGELQFFSVARSDS